MRIGTSTWRDGQWRASGEILSPAAVDLVLCFASPAALARGCYEGLRQAAPNAIRAGCSTGGEIHDRDVFDDGAVAAFVDFETARCEAAAVDIQAAEGSFDAGAALATKLAQASLKAVFLISDGLSVNGSGLVAGLRSVLQPEVLIAGGLAGDGADFGRTLVGLGDDMRSGQIVAIGFYGDRLAASASSHGGWSLFGPERRITRSSGAVLFELDGRPALELYKRYLGEQASQLPGSALLFPLAIKPASSSEEPLTRTIVGVSEADQSLTFAGDVPEGWIAQLMHAAKHELVEGAIDAARGASSGMTIDRPTLAVLVSCIGRKLMLGQRVAEEVEGIAATWGDGATPIGFYSYGEIGPHGVTGRCTLHNQTMTALLLTEV